MVHGIPAGEGLHSKPVSMEIILYEVIEAISNKVRHAREGLVAEIILCSIDTGRVTLTTDQGNYPFT